MSVTTVKNIIIYLFNPLLQLFIIFSFFIVSLYNVIVIYTLISAMIRVSLNYEDTFYLLFLT